MHSTMRATLLAAAGVTILAGCASTPPQPSAKTLTFFVTSVGPGKGGDLGGLAGADAHCQKLAAAAGASPDRVWRAYLSTQAPRSPIRTGQRARSHRPGPGRMPRAM
jgi:hypothetical protein